MAEIERFFSMIRREVERSVSKLVKAPRMGLVSSYDKVNHAVKVKFQPSGTESGWIPLTGIAVGNQFGALFAPNINDQVEIAFHRGDHMVARVMTRHFSLADQPPQIEAGEYAQIHQSGSVITHKKDGTLMIGGAGTVTTGQIGGGTSGNTSTGGATGETGQAAATQPYTQPNAKQTITLKPNGEVVIDAPVNDISVTADATSINIKTGQNLNKQVGENLAETIGGNKTETITGSKTETIGGSKTVSAPSVTINAPSVAINGNTAIQGNLNVSGMIVGTVVSPMGS